MYFKGKKFSFSVILKLAHFDSKIKIWIIKAIKIKLNDSDFHDNNIQRKRGRSEEF